jgi:hypothetical protein
MHLLDIQTIACTNEGQGTCVQRFEGLACVSIPNQIELVEDTTRMTGNIHSFL